MAETAKDELARRLGEYPKEALTFLQGAFASASRLKDETLDLILKEVVANFERGSRRLGGSNLAAITGLPERDAEHLGSVYTVVIGLLSGSTASPDDFVAAAKNILFLPDQEVVAKRIANSICARRAEIKLAVDRAQLAGAILPSLFTFEIAVDVRIRVVDGEIAATVPTVLVYIDTDADNQDLWLQLTKADVESLISKLTKTLEEIKLAETLAPRKS